MKEVKTKHKHETGCSDCYELTPVYYDTENGSKVCPLCGGTVLDTQEMLDKIADLKIELKNLEEYYNGIYS